MVPDRRRRETRPDTVSAKSVSIVPLTVSGTRHVMKKGRLMTRPGHVTLRVHQPIAAAKIDSPTSDHARDLAVRIQEIVRSGIDASVA